MSNMEQYNERLISFENFRCKKQARGGILARDGFYLNAQGQIVCYSCNMRILDEWSHNIKQHRKNTGCTHIRATHFTHVVHPRHGEERVSDGTWLDNDTTGASTVPTEIYRHEQVGNFNWLARKIIFFFFL